VDPALRTWRARRHANEHAPAVQAGHLQSFHSGAPERLALEDADQNQMKNWTVENRWRQGITMTTAVEIGGVPVERATAERWERLSLLPKGTVAKAPSHPGWS
jgi:Bacterial toxin 5